MKTAKILLYIVSISGIYFGASYILTAYTKKLVLYHSKLLGGKKFHDLGPAIGFLYSTNVAAIGFLFLSLGFTNMLLSYCLTKNNSQIWWIVLILNLTSLIPLMLANLKNGLDSPWWLNAIVIVLVITALWLSYPDNKS